MCLPIAFSGETAERLTRLAYLVPPDPRERKDGLPGHSLQLTLFHSFTFSTTVSYLVGFPRTNVETHVVNKRHYVEVLFGFMRIILFSQVQCDNFVTDFVINREHNISLGEWPLGVDGSQRYGRRTDTLW